MIIGVFGISGVGKTKFTKELQFYCPGVIRFSASELIAKFNGVINYDDLKGEVIDDNQKKLMVSLNEISKVYKYRNVVVELHNVIETHEGLSFIEKNVLKDLNLDAVFFIKKEPAIIKLNRENDTKKRRLVNEYEIAELQKKAVSYFSEVYNTTSQHIISGNRDDIQRICNFINSFD